MGGGFKIPCAQEGVPHGVLSTPQKSSLAEMQKMTNYKNEKITKEKTGQRKYGLQDNARMGQGYNF